MTPGEPGGGVAADHLRGPEGPLDPNVVAERPEGGGEIGLTLPLEANPVGPPLAVEPGLGERLCRGQFVIGTMPK